MGSHFTSITDEQAELIRHSKLFFVATADPALQPGPHGIGPVNVSPKGNVALHVLTPTRVAFLNYSGSGNETARHLQAGGPMTLMVCSFDTDAAIVRLFGRGTATPAEDSPLAEQLLRGLPDHLQRARQVIVMDVESTATSCGYGVPVMSFEHDRPAYERGKRFKPKS